MLAENYLPATAGDFPALAGMLQIVIDLGAQLLGCSKAIKFTSYLESAFNRLSVFCQQKTTAWHDIETALVNGIDHHGVRDVNIDSGFLDRFVSTQPRMAPGRLLHTARGWSTYHITISILHSLIRRSSSRVRTMYVWNRFTCSLPASPSSCRRDSSASNISTASRKDSGSLAKMA